MYKPSLGFRLGRGSAGSVGVIRLVHLRYLMRAPLRTALAILAIGAATSLALAVAVVQHSFDSSVAGFFKTVAGPAPLRVVGPEIRGGLSDATVAKVRSIPGVAAAVPMVQAVTLAQRSDGLSAPVTALGVDCSVQNLIGDVGCSEAAIDQASASTPPVESASLARLLGAGSVVRTDLGRVSTDGAATVPQLDRLNDGRIVVFALPEAQLLFGRPGRVDIIYIKPDPAVSIATLQNRVAQTLGPADSVLNGGQVPSGAQYATYLVPELALVSFMALLVGGLLMYNLLSLSLAERRRDIAVMASLGEGRRLLVAGVLTEAGAIGAAGGLLGWAGGSVLAAPLVSSLSHISEQLLGLRITVHLSYWLALAGLLLGVGVAVVTALLTVRSATGLDLAAELHERSSRPEASAAARGVRGVVFAVLTAAGVVLSHLSQIRGGSLPWQPTAGMIGLAVTAIGLTGFVSSMTPLLVQWLHRRTQRGRGSLAIAVTSLTRDTRRAVTTCVAMALAVGVATVLASLVPAIHEKSMAFAGQVIGNRLYVSTLGNENTAGIDADLPPAAVQRIAQLPGVASIRPDLFVTAADGQGRLLFVDNNGVDRRDAFHVISGHATPSQLAAGEVFVGVGLARRDHLTIGSMLTVKGLNGLAKLKVAAVWANPDSNGYAATLDPATMTRIWGYQPSLDVLVTPKPGWTADQLATEVTALHIDPNLEALTPPQYADELSSRIGHDLAPFWAMQKGLMMVAFIATLSTLLLAGIQRRRELGVITALGLAPSQLARLTVIEAGVLGLIGSAFGLVCAAALFDSLRLYASFTFGVAPPYRFDLPPSLPYVGLGLLVAVAGAALPAWRSARTPILTALRYE